MLPKSDLAVPVGGDMTFEDATKSPKKEGSAGGSGGSMLSINNPALASGVTAARKDPNEEFFMMTILSYKLTHKEYEKVLAVRILRLIRFRLMESSSSKKPASRVCRSMSGPNGSSNVSRRSSSTTCTVKTTARRRGSFLKCPTQ
jgi:hypothetical protein